MTTPEGPRKSHPIPPATFSGRNLSDMQLILSNGYDVTEWTPQKNGEGQPEAVCLVLHFGGPLDGAGIVMRIKSRLECNRLIQILERHRDGVWPMLEPVKCAVCKEAVPAGGLTFVCGACFDHLH